MTKETKGINRRWLWVALAITLLVVFYVVRSMTVDRLPVRVATAIHANLASTQSTNGRVEPESNYELHSPISTTVKAVYVQPGDKVSAGKLLMVLDDTDARARLAAAESGVKTAQAALETVLNNGNREQQLAAQSDLSRSRLERDQAALSLEALKKLQATGAASLSEVAAAQQRLASANASLEAIEASAKQRYGSSDIARARAALADAEANLAAAREVENQTQVRAPISGTVYSMNAGPTEYVDPGKLLLEMADLSQERIRAYFDEPEIGRLRVGQPIVIKWDALPGREWHGHIERTPSTVVTQTTRTVGETLVKIDDSDSGLLPDTNVTVTVTTSDESNALSIPRQCLYSENGKPYVFKVVNGQLKRTPVVLGPYNLTLAAIRSGLQEGDVVATGTSSGQPLQEGVPIKVVP
ncbi:MAG TPA: efflux RND transporter periplasmic adaptor subunit [Terracidiphilus sp.]|nr:efflux RND transporter periplasmic adaptor subunit [Terracidiphilus sp.]